jgi:4-amino-4-deoxy-L-arabinose transferase-like glycosyltransferase
VKAEGTRGRGAPDTGEGQVFPSKQHPLRPLAFCLLVFLVAFGARLLMREDGRAEVGKVQTSVTENYKHMARLLAEEGAGGFWSASSPLADPDTLGHPPGYPVLIALVRGAGGETDAALQLVQIAADSLAAVLVLLIAKELLSVWAAAAVAGLLVALAPQFAWNSVLLLPDTLAALPILAAVYLVALSLRRPRPALFVAAGILIGLSCWLRANALLLAPFLAAAVHLLFRGGAGARYGLALAAGAVLAVAPLTLRNALVFGAFIPVSLGAGQTLLEGIGDYDPEGRFGIPSTDVEIQRQEAERFRRPDYAQTLFGPDAVLRERRRLARGREFILERPFWFASVMVRRAASMLRLERTPRVSPRPAGGDASALTLLPRLAVAGAQRLFITAVMLPLALAGVALLAREKKWRALVVLLAVPVYYLCVQSALHTEYRYVLAVHYLLFAAVAYGLCRAAGKIVSLRSRQ